MLQKEIYPSEILKKYVKKYYIMEVEYPQIDFLPKQRIYTYGCIVLVFHYGQPSLFQPKNGSAEIEPRTVICGQQTNYYDLSLAGKTGMIFIIFQPYAAGLFFEIPMYEIANRNIALECLIAKEAPDIEDKIQNANSIRQRVKIIEDFLVKRLIKNHRNNDRIITSFHSIKQNKGQISIKRLAEIACLSIKQFERKFSALIGLNPKQYSRIIRFQYALELKKDNNFKSYTTMAFDCGYFDQAHFINDFKLITDLTPKEFFNHHNQTL